MKHTENKTIDWRERFRKKYHIEDDWDFELYQKIPSGWKNANREIEQFIQQELDLALKERTESLIEEIDAWIPEGQIGMMSSLTFQNKLKELKSKYLKQEEKDERIT